MFAAGAVVAKVASRRTKRHALGFAFVLAMGATTASLPAWSESLGEALASAYSNNPRLNAERARLRATDQELARAQSGYRPTIFGTADYFMYQRTETQPNSFNDGITSPKNLSLNFQQPLYSGGRTVNAVRQADQVIMASREQLRGVEQQLFIDGVTAYVNVIRDQEIFRLRQSNVEVLSKELKATEERFAVGEVTKTDVAQARARRAASVSALDLAKANLRSSIADYERVTGHPPASLEEPSVRADLIPTDLEEAIRIGETQHPDVVAAAFFERAAGYNVNVIEGELLPDLRLEATYTDRVDPTRTVERQETGQIVARLTVPIYQGGGPGARVRQARVLRQMTATAVMEQMGCSWETLHALNSRLIMASISGFGQDGPYASRPCFDVIGQAMGGLMELTGQPGGPPTQAGTFVVDYSAGLYATIGILAALRERDRTGEGQHLDLALLDTAVSLLVTAIPEHLLFGANPTRLGNRDRFIAPANSFETRDGEWIHVMAGSDAHFPRIARAMDRLDLLDDPRFATQVERLAHEHEVESIVADWIRGLSTDDALARLAEYEIPSAKVATVADVVADAQLAYRGQIISIDHPIAGSMPTQANPIHLSATPPVVKRPAPGLGEHNQEVLAEWLGFDLETVADLAANRVI